MKAFLIISVLVGIQFSDSFAQKVNAKGGGGGSQTETTAANLKAKAAIANQICLDKIAPQIPPCPLCRTQNNSNQQNTNAVTAPVGKISKTVTYSKGK